MLMNWHSGTFGSEGVALAQQDSLWRQKRSGNLPSFDAAEGTMPIIDDLGRQLGTWIKELDSDDSLQVERVAGGKRLHWALNDGFQFVELRLRPASRRYPAYVDPLVGVFFPALADMTRRLMGSRSEQFQWLGGDYSYVSGVIAQTARLGPDGYFKTRETFEIANPSTNEPPQGVAMAIRAIGSPLFSSVGSTLEFLNCYLDGCAELERSAETRMSAIAAAATLGRLEQAELLFAERGSLRTLTRFAEVPAHLAELIRQVGSSGGA